MGVHGVRLLIYGKSFPRNGFIIIEDQVEDENGLWFDWEAVKLEIFCLF